MAYARGGPLPPRDDDSVPAFVDPHCSYYIPRSQLPDQVLQGMKRYVRDFAAGFIEEPLVEEEDVD